jgi:hypothetical protein
VAYFSTAKEWLFNVHIHHALHHKLTTKNHHLRTGFSKIPLKNTSKNSKTPAQPRSYFFLRKVVLNYSAFPSALSL